MRFLWQNILGIVLFGIFISCTSVKKEPEKSEQQISLVESYQKSSSAEKIPAGKCRIAATIIKIDNKFLSSNPEDPCSKAPCKAIVRIDRIVGYGSAFPTTFSKGQEISINFKFTLLPSNQVKPDLKISLPGLKENSSFTADVEANPVLGAGDQFQYLIYKYQLK